MLQLRKQLGRFCFGNGRKLSAYERGERNHHTSTYIAGQQYESLIAIKATIPSFGDGFEGPKSL